LESRSSAAESAWVMTFLPARSARVLTLESFGTTTTWRFSMYGFVNA
jgi:hypothetical protein